jgi:hypothetical protein
MRTPLQRRQSGQGNFEYVGFVLIVVLIVVVLVNSPAAPYLSDKFRAAICRLSQIAGGGPCSAATAPETNKAFQPDAPCLVFASEEAGDVSATVSFFEVGKGVILRKEVYADGSLDLTVLDEGSASAEAGLEAKKEIGNVGELGGSIDIGGGVELKLGGTYHFESKKAASELLNNIDAYRRKHREWNDIWVVGPTLAWGYRAFARPEVPDDPTIGRRELDAEVRADGQATAFGGLPGEGSGSSRRSSKGTLTSESTSSSTSQPIDEGSATTETTDSGATAELVAQLEPQLEGSVRATVHGEATMDVDLLTDHRNGEKTRVYQVGYRGSVEVAARYQAQVLARLKGRAKAHRGNTRLQAAGTATGDATLQGQKSAKIDVGRQGAVSITRDKEGKVVEVKLVREERNNNELTTAETTLDVRNQAQRRLVNRWLMATPTPLRAVGVAIKDPASSIQEGVKSTDMDRLLFNSADVSRIKYHESIDEQQAERELGQGQKVGVAGRLVDTTQRASSAQYLGAPRSGERHYIPYSECQK